MLCFRKILAAKTLKDKREVEYQEFPSKVFCLTVPETFLEEFFCDVFQKISGSEKVLEQKWGVSRFYFENFVSHSVENFRRGALLCCVQENFRKPKSFMDKREVEYQEFPSKNFCPTVPKKFVGEPFCDVFQKSSVSGKNVDKRGGGSIRLFRQKLFVSQCRKFS